MRAALALLLALVPALASNCAISSAVTTFYLYVGIYGTLLLLLYALTMQIIGALGGLLPASVASAVQGAFLYAAGALVLLGIFLAILAYATARALGA
ncbi:MAG: hypothetical protein GXO07_06885 [Crenarchaeota archaeon]|nr:hypothetical protein [Thermoproteota archaeon]